MRVTRSFVLLTSLASLLTVSACASQGHPAQARSTPATKAALPSPVKSAHQEALDDTLLQSSLDEQDGLAYRVGPGDVLLINVYRVPELSTPTTGARAGKAAGFVVDNDGTVQLPLLGAITVGGKTPREIQALLEQKLSRELKKPNVSVQVQQNGSLRYYLLGEFSQPGMKTADRPMSLLQVLALGGSINLTNADLRRSYITRNGKKLPINFYRLIRQGDLRQNIRLRSDDTIVVPDNKNEQAFVFGSVSKGGAVPFVNGHLDLLQALAQAGMGPSEYANGHLEDIRIIRGESDRAQFIVVDAQQIMDGKAAPFLLEPGDIVYVPNSRVSNWNQAIQQILPSLQAVSSVINPFVQIKFLSQ